jgi:predicted  nucleic acid-binding Zn ribbon protein
MIAEITFGKPMKNSRLDYSSDDIVEEFIIQLQKNGQVLGDEFSYDTIKGKVTAYVDLPHQNSLNFSNYSEYCKTSLERIKVLFDSEPKWKILSDKINVPLPNWRRAEYLTLFTHAFEYNSPICMAKTGKSVPLYEFPLTALEKEEIFHWAGAYRLHDMLWIYSGKLEIPAYKQLADPESQLSREGRKFCWNIEEKTGKKVFYYLMRYWGRRSGEANRRCPSCGGSWQCKPIKSKTTFWNFAFKCNKCRLVSNIPDNIDEPKYAKIGEFNSKIRNSHQKEKH